MFLVTTKVVLQVLFLKYNLCKIKAYFCHTSNHLEHIVLNV